MVVNLKPGGDQEIAKSSLVDLQKALAPFEQELAKRSTIFFGGKYVFDKIA